MLTQPIIDPIAFSLGPISVHWYGIMYLIGFGCAYWLGTQRSKTPYSPVTAEQMGDLIYYAAIGVILGGRLGYILFYDLSHYLSTPLDIFKVWRGGMSFHGGFLGVLVAMAWYARHLGRSFFQLTDFIAPLVPLGLLAGRIGNFINGELWGRETDVAWGMIFHHPAAGGVVRHPSQLYEAALEGLVLFILLWVYSRKPRPTMAVSALFLIGYGAFRSFVEFFRTPDEIFRSEGEQLGFIAFDWLTMGQLLSIPMIIVGGILFYLAHKKMPAK